MGIFMSRRCQKCGEWYSMVTFAEDTDKHCCVTKIIEDLSEKIPVVFCGPRCFVVSRTVALLLVGVVAFVLLV